MSELRLSELNNSYLPCSINIECAAELIPDPLDQCRGFKDLTVRAVLKNIHDDLIIVRIGAFKLIATILKIMSFFVIFKRF